MTLSSFYENLESQMRDSYYAIVRFCPDRARGEQINIAVILEAPQSGFLGVKVRKGMTRLIKNFAPHVDERLIFDFASGLERDFAAKPESHRGERLFPEPEKPVHIQSLVDLISDAPRSLWTISEPQHITVMDDVKWTDEINHLYAMFLANHSAPQVEMWDKQKVQGYSYTGLRQRDVTLDLHPKPISGSVYDNEFDAGYSENGLTGHFQFFSYETNDPDLNQMIRFLSSVDDARESGYTPEKGYYFAPIIRRPQSAAGQARYNKALSYCAKKKVRAFAAVEGDLDRIAYAFKNRDGYSLSRI